MTLVPTTFEISNHHLFNTFSNVESPHKIHELSKKCSFTNVIDSSDPIDQVYLLASRVENNLLKDAIFKKHGYF